MYSLYEYNFDEDKVELKQLCKRHKEKFKRKFKQKLPSADDDDIKNFIRIYLTPIYDDEKEIDLGDFMFRDECYINRTYFTGINLKELHVDHNYW